MQDSDIKAMVLAAGEGARMRPFTLNTPKPLLPIVKTPIIEHILRWLKHHNISKIAVNLNYLGDKIETFLGNGLRYDMEITYSKENSVLGTAGGVKLVGWFFNRTFIVVYSDVLTRFDLSSMVAYHQRRKALATIALFNTPHNSEVGVVEIADDGKMLDFVEKREIVDKKYKVDILANAGIYVLEKEILEYIPEKQYSDFAYDIFPKLIQQNLPIFGYVLSPDDYLIDIGTLNNYSKAKQDVKSGSFVLYDE